MATPPDVAKFYDMANLLTGTSQESEKARILCTQRAGREELCDDFKIPYDQPQDVGFNFVRYQEGNHYTDLVQGLINASKNTLVDEPYTGPGGPRPPTNPWDGTNLWDFLYQLATDSILSKEFYGGTLDKKKEMVGVFLPENQYDMRDAIDTLLESPADDGPLASSMKRMSGAFEAEFESGC